VLAISPAGEIHFSRGDRYEVLVLSPAGDTLRVVRRALEPRADGATIAALRVDRSGYLWVAAPMGEGWRTMEWSVHDPEGRYLGPIATPVLEVTDIGRDYLAGIETDERGGQRAVVYPLNR
jgi:sugar lactone lactonase YvrE